MGGEQTVREAHLAARRRAAELQERLGIAVSAASDNDWRGAYAIVDFDALDRLAASRGVPGQEFDAPELIPVGEHECVTCRRCSVTFAAVHPACPRCAEEWRSGVPGSAEGASLAEGGHTGDEALREAYQRARAYLVEISHQPARIDGQAFHAVRQFVRAADAALSAAGKPARGDARDAVVEAAEALYHNIEDEPGDDFHERVDALGAALAALRATREEQP